MKLRLPVREQVAAPIAQDSAQDSAQDAAPPPVRRVVFAGTPEFAVPMLKMLSALPGIELVAVYTQPDRPSGRGKQAHASAVKQAALALRLPVLQPETLRSADVQAQLRLLRPDLMVVVAYGLILPKPVLEIPRAGCWNIHASLLPRWRGAAPIQRAIAAGDERTGVALMQMEQGLDTGPVLLELSTEIALNETGESLHDRLSELGAVLLKDGIEGCLAGALPAATTQSEHGVCYASKLEKEEGVLEWDQSALPLLRKIRAFWPWPSVSLPMDQERVQIAQAELDPRPLPPGCQPGDLISCDKDGVILACADGAVRVRQLKPAGGRLMAARDFANGRPRWRENAKGWS